jgi:aryl-alcohol dehydrogenase-like predicted oxidoreductase
MEMRSFGSTGMQVGTLGLGAAEIGYENTSDQTIDSLFGVALDNGINVIDTAAMYGDSEEKIGRAVRGKRNKYLLFTKCGRSPRPTTLLTRVGRKLLSPLSRVAQPDHHSWHPRTLLSNIDQSLRRMGTHWIDLIQLHSCSELTLRRGRVIEALIRARESGKVRYLGFSGDGPAALYAIQCGHFDAIQISVNVADQEALDEILPIARERGIAVIAKRPIANGLWRSPNMPEPTHYRTYWSRLKELAYEFLKSESAFEMALRFPLSVPGVHTAIVGTTKPVHLFQDAKFATNGMMEDDQFSSIRKRWKEIARSDWVGQM